MAGCIVLVVPQHWERALLRAELIERGQDVAALRGMGDLLFFHPAQAGHAPIAVILVDRKALAGRRRKLLPVVRARNPAARFVLLAGGMDTIKDDGATVVLRRPLSIGQVATKLGELAASESRRPAARSPTTTGSRR
jgi:hypothetical protein